ncbi:MAG TPA: ABC transporter ATP-binding protein, partial [Gaiellaceae bacterium]|nr:ABC transporter ATP-binding protein [Gaiellaceae bacterium]
MAEVIRAEQLTKSYGQNRGIIDVDFSVEGGEVFGYLGPNGAGKSTTIRLLLDLIRPTSGRLTLFGLDSRRKSVEIRRRLGYLPGDLRLYERMTGGDLLTYFGHLRGLDGLQRGRQLAERLDLDLGRQIKELSRGNRQKVGIVQAFMHEPDLLVLDEPTSGLDPLVQETFSELVAEATRRGGTIFLSSHVLSEVQHMADRVGLIREGRLDLVDSVENLRAAFTHVEATFAEPPPADAFAGVAGVERIEQDGNVVRFAFEGEIDPLLKALARFHVKALDVREA